MMSNAKLKEQIEAAKIALVHSVEAGSWADTPPTTATVTQISSIDANHAEPNVNNGAETAHSPADAKTARVGQDVIPQTDFEKLEARLQELEDQIKNQQRDLHTLLQKLRDITAKSQAVAKPKKSKSTTKWLAGAALCIMGFGLIRSFHLNQIFNNLKLNFQIKKEKLLYELYLLLVRLK